MCLILKDYSEQKKVISVNIVAKILANLRLWVDMSLNRIKSSFMNRKISR
jgi:hypothetical protein